MIASLLLIWIGIKLSAPWWFYIFAGCALLLNLLKFSVRMGNAIHKSMGD